jgi:hypothetical protein
MNVDFSDVRNTSLISNPLHFALASCTLHVAHRLVVEVYLKAHSHDGFRSRHYRREEQSYEHIIC